MARTLAGSSISQTCARARAVSIRVLSSIRRTIMKQILVRSAAGFPPGSFSFIMATGIVSLSAFQQRMETTAAALFFLNKIAYAVLIFLLVLRGLLLPRELISDITSPSRAPALFTTTAGTCLLGSQYLVFSGDVRAGVSFWIAGSFFWVVLCYAFFASVIVRHEKTAGESEIGGEWLIYVVGTQAVAIITMLLAPGLGRRLDGMLLGAASLHLIGSALYFIIIILIVHRMMFRSLPPEKLTPPYWINMGASAISTLAGAELILQAGHGSMVPEILPALKWTTLLLWAMTTWWIPLMAILNVWRYGYKRFPIAYDVEHWSMVFPLGMYAACSFQLGNAMKLTALIQISRYFAYLALTAWIVTFLGMASGFIRKAF
jgi:tellurite resistance protein TehA-like permease